MGIVICGTMELRKDLVMDQLKAINAMVKGEKNKKESFVYH